MATPDLEVIKEIPGYKVILKAVLKAQIQQLVEQLADHTDEESVILTANVSDGTLCHLGSESGKIFLNDHDDIKSQFLGFCLKRQHKKKQKEKEDAAQRSVPTTPPRPGSGFGARPRIGTSPRHQFSPTRFQTSPRQNIPQGPHPVSLTKATAHGAPVRTSPYPVSRPLRRPNITPTGGSRPPKPMRLPVASDNDTVDKRGPVIKIELNDDDLKIENDGSGAPISSQSESSTSQITPSTPQPSTSTANDATTEPKSDSSPSTIPQEPLELKLPEGLGLDSDLSNLISDTAKPTLDMNIPPAMPQSGGSGSAPPTPGASNVDPNVNVKVEAITESEMDLEITGVEPGWDGRGMGGYNPTSGASGNQGDMPDDQSEQEYTMELQAIDTSFHEADAVDDGGDAVLLSENDIGIHHEEEAQVNNTVGGNDDEQQVRKCTMCEFTCNIHDKNAMRRHKSRSHRHFKFFCDCCGQQYETKFGLNLHMKKVHTKEAKHACMICGKTYVQNKPFTDHVNSHHKIRAYKCEKCNTTFTHMTSKRRHAKSCGVASEKHIICETCGMSFQRAFELKEHKAGKHNPPRYTCQCGKWYHWRSSFNKHRARCGNNVDT